MKAGDKRLFGAPDSESFRGLTEKEVGGLKKENGS